MITGYVDIHAHVLPGIDDGPPDLNQALAMARAAVDSGITTIAATPHLRSDFPGVHVNELAERCQQLREALEREGIPLQLVSGAEVSLSWAIDASDEELLLASYGQRGTDLLIETPFTQLVGLDRFLYQLRAKGYRITLGHPERSFQFQQDPAALRELVDQGVLIQVNAESLIGGGARRGPKRLARELVSEALAHVIASDGHRGTSWRPVARLSEAVHQATGLVGHERAAWMVEAAPMAIASGVALPEWPSISTRQKRRRLSAWVSGGRRSR